MRRCDLDGSLSSYLPDTVNTNSTQGLTMLSVHTGKSDKINSHYAY